jgi:hypothetical protein
MTSDDAGVMGVFVEKRTIRAFSIGQSALDDTIAYIAHQPEHHPRRTFEEKFRG